MHYYQFHISDWALHTSHLDIEEEAIYRRLLDYYYDTEQPIPTETQRVIRRLRLGAHTDLVGLILEEFFIKKADGWHNLRADKEIAEYNAKAETARANGKKGGRPKKQKQLFAVNERPEKTQLDNLANPEKTKLKANQEPQTTNQKPLTTSDEAINFTSCTLVSLPPPLKRPNHQTLIDEWQPSSATLEALAKLHRIPEQFTAEQLVEFKTYWRDRADPKTSWDAAFLTRCPQQWKRNGVAWLKVSDGQFIDKHTDRSWAEGL